MIVVEPVELVKISRLIKIYKNGEEANAIEVARVSRMDGDELQYDIVVQKGFYNIGETVVYIQPDYCLPQHNIFNEYHFPGGDEGKCRLGKKGRIRAIKFNLNFEGDKNPIYSFGIIIKITDVVEELITLGGTDGKSLTDTFGITKYEADDSLEKQAKGMIDGPFPGHILYKTDEPTIQNCKIDVDEAYANNEELTFSIKKDGSSITEYYFHEDEMGICSRKMKKKMDQTYTKGYLDGDVILHKYFQKDTNTLGWYNEITGVFYTDEEAQGKFAAITAVHADAWIDTVKKYGYDSFFDYCRNENLQLAIRGELIGAGNKGSGNKLNSDAKLPVSDIYWFGVDDLSSGRAIRNHYGCEYNLKRVSEDLGLIYAEPVLEGVFDYNGIIQACHEIFRKIKEEKGIVIEGIVIRTKYSNNLSVKYINPEYDAKS